MTGESDSGKAGVRLDRWLWAARFFKTRAQAKAAIEAGHVDFHGRTTVSEPGRGPAAQKQLPGEKPKVSKEVAIGDMLTIRRGWTVATVVILGLSASRGSATVAQALYEETLDSIERRETDTARRKMERAGLRVPDRRPSKHDRRALLLLKKQLLKKQSQQQEQ